MPYFILFTTEFDLCAVALRVAHGQYVQRVLIDGSTGRQLVAIKFENQGKERSTSAYRAYVVLVYI